MHESTTYGQCVLTMRLRFIAFSPMNSAGRPPEVVQPRGHIVGTVMPALRAGLQRLLVALFRLFEDAL